MADSGNKPQYRVEYQLRYLQGDPNEFLVDDVAISDALNQCYRVTVRCRIPAARSQSAHEACAGRRLKDVELVLRRRFPDGSVLESRVLGVILSIERASVADADDPFTLTIVPAMALLAHHTEGGTWHDRSDADVLREVLRRGLSGYGRTLEDRLTKTYPQIDLIVRRPDEDLLEFVRRLAARAGINFFFRHDGGVEMVVLCDTNDGFVDGVQRQDRDKPFRPTWFPHATDGEEQVTSVSSRAQLGPDEVELLGFDVAGTPLEPVKGLFRRDGGHAAKRRKSDGFRVNERENADAQHGRIAQLEGEVEATRSAVMELRTTIVGALAGRRYRFENELGNVQECIVVGVQAGGRSFANPGSDYANQIEVVPTTGPGGESLPVRAPRPAEDSAFPAIMRARIEAIDNDPVDVDGLMRCRLRFSWDQSTDEVPTTYVSVLQPMAGSFGGTQYIPRAGDRVLVSFLGGNLERPVILGCLYDKENAPPVMGPPERAQSLPASASWLGWNHASIGDKSRQSMLAMDVTAGAELMYWNAPFDWRQDVGNDADLRIARDERRAIGRDLDEQVEGSLRQRVAGSREETVGGDYSLRVAGGGIIDIAGRTTVSYGGAITSTCQGGATSHVEGGVTENVMSGDRITRVAGGACRFASNGAFVVSATSVSIGSGGMGGGSGPAAGGALSLGQTASLACPGGASVQSGPSRVETGPEGVTVRGPSAGLRDQAGGAATLAAGSYTVDVPQGIVLRCGPTELRLTPQGLFVNGQQIVLQGARTQIRTAALDIDPPDDESED